MCDLMAGCQVRAVDTGAALSLHRHLRGACWPRHRMQAPLCLSGVDVRCLNCVLPAGLNMLNQAREFHQVVQVTGILLTKLDGTARGGAVVSVVDELGVPVKFVGVGETVADLQPFDAQAFVDALFPDDELEPSQ